MKSWIKKIPYIKQVYDSYRAIEYKKKFATVGYGSFWGVFDTFDAAQAAAPHTKKIGYNDPDLAKDYRRMLEQNNWENTESMIRSYDYPVLFWLKSLLHKDCNKIIDFGGNVGIHYYTYSQYLEYPENLEWTICEVPEIAEIGKELGESRAANCLFFTSDWDSFNQKDIFIASGSIQYVQDLATTLDRYAQKPKHLLINRLPLYDGMRFVTLQNGGQVFYPQFVFNKTEFIESIRQIGYELIDLWEDRNDNCYIPGHQDRSVNCYSGLYAKLKSSIDDDEWKQPVTQLSNAKVITLD